MNAYLINSKEKLMKLWGTFNIFDNNCNEEYKVYYTKTSLNRIRKANKKDFEASLISQLC